MTTPRFNLPGVTYPEPAPRRKGRPRYVLINGRNVSKRWLYFQKRKGPTRPI